jgi:hypothetical protein
MGQDAVDGHVAIPLGLVALTWLRLYLPLTAADLSQSVLNTEGAVRLGFAREGFKALLKGLVSPLDLKVGASVSGGAAATQHAALRDASDTIARMPATFMTYPGSNRLSCRSSGCGARLPRTPPFGHARTRPERATDHTRQASHLSPEPRCG